MARKIDAIDDQKLIEILRKEEWAAYNYQTSDLMQVRDDALNYYDRKPYGDEQEGSSQVVTSEFQDTIESMMPGLMDVFAGGDNVVEFMPLEEGQEQYAQEATDYVAHVFMRMNDGFKILYWLIKDALMYRLGGMTVDIEEYTKERVFPVTNLPEDQINVLAAKEEEAGAEITLDLIKDEIPTIQPGMLPAADTFSGDITVKLKRKRVVCENIAPEDIRFTPTARDIDKASYLGYLRRTTASELVAMGLKQEEVDSLRTDRDISPEENQRNDAAILNANDRDVVGDSERKLWLVIAYVKIDLDDDGISDTLRVVYAHAGGTAGRIIEKIPWEGPASVVLATPILMSHIIPGRGIFDQCQDLQQIGSVLTRGYLNNLYQVNMPRPIVSDQVVLDTLLDWVPGSPIRLKSGARPDQNHVTWLQVPPVGGEILKGMEYFKTVREDRTGVMRNSNGQAEISPQNDTFGAFNALMGAAQRRMELIARTLGETAIKRIYRLIYRALKRAATGPTRYYGADRQFVTVDPTKWPDDMDLSVNVGLGTGGKEQALQNLGAIASAQEKLINLQGGQANGPYVTPDNIANTSQKMAEKLGFKTPGMFFQPAVKVMQAVQKQAQQPPPPSPEMAAVQAQSQAEMAKVQSQAQAKQVELQQKAQLEAQQIQHDAQIQQQKLAAEVALKRQAAEADLQIAREKAAQEMQLAREKAALDAQLKREELVLEAQLKQQEIRMNPEPDDTEIKEQSV